MNNPTMARPVRKLILLEPAVENLKKISLGDDEDGELHSDDDDNGDGEDDDDDNDDEDNTQENSTSEPICVSLSITSGQSEPHQVAPDYFIVIINYHHGDD